MIILLVLAPYPVCAQTAVLELNGPDDEDVVGLHITSDIVREAADALPEGVTDLVLTLDSRGGFLAEIPTLAGLIAVELPERFDVTLVVREASSTAAILALTAPRLAIHEGGALRGHRPFERLGEIDLDLRGDDLDVALSVAEGCAIMGDRPQPVARALTAPRFLGLNKEGEATENRELSVATVHEGEDVLTLTPHQAVNVGAADVVIAREDDLFERLGLPARVTTTASRVVLEEHRARVSERIARLDESLAELRALIETPLDDAVHARALDLLGRIETIHLVRPRVALLRGVDTPALDDLVDRIDVQRDAYVRTRPSTMPP